MKNLLENALREAYSDLVGQNADFCGCPTCKEDVMAYALNKIRPRYTGGGDLGTALANLDLQKDGARATIAVVMLEAIRRVAANPHREPVRTGLAGGDGA